MHDRECILNDVISIVTVTEELSGEQRGTADVAPDEHGKCRRIAIRGAVEERCICPAVILHAQTLIANRTGASRSDAVSLPPAESLSGPAQRKRRCLFTASKRSLHGLRLRFGRGGNGRGRLAHVAREFLRPCERTVRRLEIGAETASRWLPGLHCHDDAMAAISPDRDLDRSGGWLAGSKRALPGAVKECVQNRPCRRVRCNVIRRMRRPNMRKGMAP
jgi:hypothetical protein